MNVSESDSDPERRLREFGHRVGPLDLSFVEGATLWSRHYDLETWWAADIERIVATAGLDRHAAIQAFLEGTRGEQQSYE